MTPELLTLTHESLSMRWSPPVGGAASYVVELAEGEDGEVADEEEWAVIYEGAPPGCEISYLAPETEYHLRVAYTSRLDGAASEFGVPLIVTTPSIFTAFFSHSYTDSRLRSSSDCSHGPRPATRRKRASGTARSQGGLGPEQAHICA